MRTALLVTTMLASMFSAGYSRAARAEPTPLRAPALLQALKAKFVGVLARHDLAAAAALTIMPMLNRTEGEPPTIPRNQFNAALQSNYFPMIECLKRQPLEPIVSPKESLGGSTWYINCDGNVFHFGMQKGSWLHFGYENINE